MHDTVGDVIIFFLFVVLGSLQPPSKSISKEVL
jgi:hypothetical protein